MKRTRELIVKFTIDWDDYDDVCDELLLEDLMKDVNIIGVVAEVYKQGE